MPAIRRNAVMPTATALMIEKAICQDSEDMACFTMPWVAWWPTIAAGATKTSAISIRAQSERMKCPA